MKRPFIPSLVLVTVYLIAVYCFLGPFGGAGHAWGIGAFMDISLPAILVAIAIDGVYPHHDITVWGGVFGGAFQYALVGYLLGRLWLLKSKK
jgi:hypothetical protein